MSTKTVRVDDLDGTSEAITTVQFGLDGQIYEIDLSEEHYEEFSEIIGKYAEAGRPSAFAAQVKRSTRNTGHKVKRTSTYSVKATKPEQQAEPPQPQEQPDIREWARSQKLRVGSRGRISDEVREAYRKAMSQSAA